MEINVLYSTDANYAKVMGVSIISLLENNKNNHINFFIIDDGICNRNVFLDLENIYGCKFNFIDFSEYKRKLNLNQLYWHISESAYARLLLNSMLPNSINKILYLDCDTIICKDLQNFFEMDLADYFVAGVLDFASHETKEMIGLNESDHYINSGVLLINVRQWRDENVEEKFIDYIKECDGNVWHHDQGVLNHVLKNNIMIINPKYNMMTPNYMLKFEDICDFYDITTKNYYTKSDFDLAMVDFVILHFTGFFVTRPWEKKCRHPKVGIYESYKSISPWKDEDLFEVKAVPLKQRIVSFFYVRLPYKIARKIMQTYYLIMKKNK